MFATLVMIASGALAAPPAPKMLTPPDGRISRVLVSPDGMAVAASVSVEANAKDGAAEGLHCLVWDAKTWAVKHAFPPEQPKVAAIVPIAFTADGKRLLDGYRAVDLETKAAAKHPKVLPFPSPGLPGWLTADGRRFAELTSETNGGVTLRVWDLDPTAMTAAEKLAIKLAKEQISSFRHTAYGLSGDGKTFVYAIPHDTKPTITVVDVATGKERVTIPLPAGGYARVFVVSADGGTIVTEHRPVSGDPLRVWDAKTGKAKAGWKTPLAGPRFTRDGKYLAGTTNNQKDVTLLDAKTGKPVAVLPTPYEGVTAFDVAPDGSWVVIAGGKLNDDRQLGIWKTADYKK